MSTKPIEPPKAPKHAVKDEDTLRIDDFVLILDLWPIAAERSQLDIVDLTEEEHKTANKRSDPGMREKFNQNLDDIYDELLDE